MTAEAIARLRRNPKPLVVSGAGIVGETVIEWCGQNGIRVDGVCDGSVKVAGSDFHGYRVIHTPRLKDRFPDALVLVTVAAIRDVVGVLNEHGFEDWMAAGPLLEDCDVAQPEAALDARKFAIETCIACHAGFLHPDRVFLRSVDLIITERCSLKCRDCANLMQYYQRPQNVDFDLLMRSIDRLCAAADEVRELRIIGGDALMNKQWPQIVERVLGEDKIKRVVIYTNGAIVPSAEQAMLLRHAKVLMIVTDYGPLSRKLGELRVFLADHGIAHRILQVDSWLDCASLDKHDRSGGDNAHVYQACCAKNMASLSDGRLFRCPFAANADRLGAVPDNAGDCVDLVGGADIVTTRRELMAYLGRVTPLATCDYCNGRPLSGKEVPPAVQVEAPRAYARVTP